jgi:phage terminase small subunit
LSNDAPTPDLLEGEGLGLWRELCDDYEFDPHERVLAVELCRTVSLCEALQRRLLAEGLVVDGQRGPKVNPIAAELRQQRIVVARLTASLGIPPLDDLEQPKPRGAARGVYVPQAARS